MMGFTNSRPSEVTQLSALYKEADIKQQGILLTTQPFKTIPSPENGVVGFIMYMKNATTTLKRKKKIDHLDLQSHTVIDAFTTPDGNIEVSGRLLYEFNSVVIEFLDLLTTDKIKELKDWMWIEPVEEVLLALEIFRRKVY